MPELPDKLRNENFRQIFGKTCFDVIRTNIRRKLQTNLKKLPKNKNTDKSKSKVCYDKDDIAYAIGYTRGRAFSKETPLFKLQLIAAALELEVEEFLDTDDMFARAVERYLKEYGVQANMSRVVDAVWMFTHRPFDSKPLEKILQDLPKKVSSE